MLTRLNKASWMVEQTGPTGQLGVDRGIKQKLANSVTVLPSVWRLPFLRRALLVISAILPLRMPWAASAKAPQGAHMSSGALHSLATSMDNKE